MIVALQRCREVLGLGKAAGVGNGHEVEVGFLDQLHGLKQAPFMDHIDERDACEQADGTAEVGAVDSQLLCYIIDEEGVGTAQDSDDGIEDLVAREGVGRQHKEFCDGCCGCKHINDGVDRFLGFFAAANI